MPTLTSQPELSICIVAWNVREILRDCLSSIRRSVSGVKYEILVVDNCSGDGTGAMVKSEFPGVVLIRNTANRGFAAASNQAIRAGRGRYLILLNPDTLVREGSLEELVSFLDLRPSAGGAGPRLLNPDGSLQPSVRSFPTFASALGRHSILGQLGCFRRAGADYLQSNFNYDRPAVVDQPMGAALMLRREALAAVGLLDERFFLYFEEVDLCRRLTRAGWPLWYNPAAEIIHRGGESTVQAGARSLFYFFQSQFCYFAKVYPPLPVGIFKLFFKPLAILGLYWSMITGGLSLAGGYLVRRPEVRLTAKKSRLKLKGEFIFRYLIRFLAL